MKSDQAFGKSIWTPLFSSLFVGVSLFGLVSSAQAQCFGYPESIGCTVNGVPNQTCLGTKTTGNVIIATGCSNSSGPLVGTGACVIRGLNGGDVIKGNQGDRNVICGGSGNDVLIGGRSNDVEIGSDGADVMVGGASDNGGTNFIDAGGGDDTAVLGGEGFCCNDGSNIVTGGNGVRDVCQTGPNGFANCEIVIQ